MLDIQLETFICVVESGSFTKAGNQLYLSPTAVMKRINMLEERVQLILFERTAQGIVLTPAGNSFYESCKLIVKNMYDAVNKAERIEKETGMTIYIGNMLGFPDVFSKVYWPKIIQRCKEFQFHYIHYHLGEDNVKVMFDDLEEKVDILMANYDQDYMSKNGMNVFKLLNIQMKCIVHRQHSLAGKRKIEIPELVGQTVFIQEDKNAQYFQRLRKELEKYPGIYVETYSVNDLEFYNRFSKDSVVFIGPEEVTRYNPVLKAIHLVWEGSIPFGIIYKKNTSQKVKKFLKKMKNLEK